MRKRRQKHRVADTSCLHEEACTHRKTWSTGKCVDINLRGGWNLNIKERSILLQDRNRNQTSFPMSSQSVTLRWKLSSLSGIHIKNSECMKDWCLKGLMTMIAKRKKYSIVRSCCMWLDELKLACLQRCTNIQKSHCTANRYLCRYTQTMLQKARKGKSGSKVWTNLSSSTIQQSGLRCGCST